MFLLLHFFACLRLRFPRGLDAIEESSVGSELDAVAMAFQMMEIGPMYPNGYDPASYIVDSQPLIPLRNLACCQYYRRLDLINHAPF